MTDLDTAYMAAAAAAVPEGREVLAVKCGPVYAHFLCTRSRGWRRISGYVLHSDTEPSMFASNIRRALEANIPEWARYLNGCKCPTERADDPCPLHRRTYKEVI